MKIEMNIGKKHFWMLLAVIVLLGGAALVFATGYDSTLASHATLFADMIRGKTGGTVTVNDNLNVTGRLNVTGVITGNGAGITGVNAAKLGGKTEGQLNVNYATSSPWSGLSGIPTGFDDDVDNTGGVLSCTTRAGLSTTTACSIASCNAGEYLTGGGCKTGSGSDNVVGWPDSGPLGGSYKCGDKGTVCEDHASAITAYAICCKIT